MIRPDLNKFPITQDFGANPNQFGYGPLGHDGTDLGTPIGTPLYAPRTGKVKDVNTNVAYGLRIKIDNGKNIDYVGHLSRAVVTVGQSVNEGDLIGYSGASGMVTGPHSHWGCYLYNGTPINPQKEMDKVNKEEPMFNEGDRVNINNSLYGKDKGWHKDQLGKPYKQAVEAILGSPDFLGESRLNDGDLANIANVSGWPLESGIKGWLWKRFWYDYAANKVSSTGEFEEVTEKLYREKK